MITPRFSCTQTAESVLVSVYCPSIRAADVEINIDENLVSLHVNPYFLRLNFSHSLLEDDASSAKYDPSSGYLTITLTKQINGQEFKDLDLLTKLLAPRETRTEPTIEVVSSQENDEADLVSKTEKLSLERDEILQAAENDWQLPQQLPQDLPYLDTSVQKYYGFLDSHSGYFRHVTHTENEINELGDDAESCPPNQRRKRRLQHEEDKWDEEYYMADYADDEQIQELLRWKHPHIAAVGQVEYTEEETLAMMRLPRKEYLAAPIQTHYLYLTLISLLFSYAYESRSTQHDPTPESAWTICNLIPAFSALDPPSSLDEKKINNPNTFSLEEITVTIITSFKRTFIFPLYRSFRLAERCQEDVAEFLLKGKRTIVRCLLEMKDILDHHEVYYVYNKIWTDDFCTWIQTYASDNILKELGELVKKAKVEKSSIDLGLEELEAATREAMNRESDSDDD